MQKSDIEKVPSFLSKRKKEEEKKKNRTDRIALTTTEFEYRND